VELAQALETVANLVAVLERLRQRIQQRCRLPRRQRQPTTYQRLEDPEHAAGLEPEPQERPAELAA
jgi:hypothetical protein